MKLQELRAKATQGIALVKEDVGYPVMISTAEFRLIGGANGATQTEAIANAKLIAHCLNTHSDILDALKMLVIAAEIVDGSETPDESDIDYLLDSIACARIKINEAENVVDN